MGSRAVRKYVKTFDPEVAHAITNVLNSALMASIFHEVGLSVTFELRHSRWILMLDRWANEKKPTLKPTYRKVVVPHCVWLSPAPFGARVRFAGVIGQDLRQWQAAAGKIGSAIGVLHVVVVEPDPGFFELELRVSDPITRPITVPYVVPAASWALPLGIDEAGSMRTLSLANVSGVVVGGLPGSGKSAWLASALGSFGSSPAVQYVVVDGKGGQDLSCLQYRSTRFLNDDFDLDAVADALSAVRDLVRDRVRNGRSLFGSPNFWDRGPSPQVPLIFVLIDECQTLLDPRQLVSKERKAVGAEIHSMVNYLVRKGRSAGVVTILATQKPTADSLPTDIRDNATLRVCFGVRSAPAATAVLGDDWSPADSPSPLGAPTGIGVAALDGGFVRFRAPYVPESAVAAHMWRFAAYRRDPWKLMVPSAPSGQAIACYADEASRMTG